MRESVRLPTRGASLKPSIPILALAALLCSCDGEPAAPPTPPEPPDGLVAGSAAYTTEKDSQPGTRITHTAPARFIPAQPSAVSLGQDPYVEFLLGAGGRLAVRTYPLANQADLASGVASASSTHTYPYTNPPVPTTGWLQILYVSSTRVDGRFEFRGGADSAGIVWTVLVRGSFSATPFEPVVGPAPPRQPNQRMQLTERARPTVRLADGGLSPTLAANRLPRSAPGESPLARSAIDAQSR
jgi:hypothetical protein